MKKLFQDPARFDPARDGQVPLRRGPGWLTLRLAYLLLRLLFSRHPGDALVWIRSMRLRGRPFALALPWLTFDAIREVRTRIGPESRVFEYGSGHSTLFWAERGATVFALEDDRNWFDLASRRLAGFPGVRPIFETGEDGYVRSIEQVSGDFDLVLVDGSYRKACIQAAIGRIKAGGLLVVDNTDWHWFNDVDDWVPAHWRKVVYPGFAPFIGYPSETSIWFKPASIHPPAAETAAGQ